MEEQQSTNLNTQHKIDVVNQMFDAWRNLDWDKILDLFTEDGVFHSMMLEPIKGREALNIWLKEQVIAAGFKSFDFKVRNIASTGNLLLIERVDSFVINGKEGFIPVNGVFEIEGNRVKEWRDYYDHAQLLKSMGIGS